MKDSTKEILLNTKNHLNELSGQLAQEFVKVVNGDWGLKKLSVASEVDSLEIEVFPDGYRMMLYPMDKSATQLGYRSLLNAYPDGLLIEKKFNVDLELYDPNNAEDKKELEEFEDAQRAIFIAWFLKSWIDTDSKKLTKHIYLVFHDTNERLDIKIGR